MDSIATSTSVHPRRTSLVRPRQAPSTSRTAPPTRSTALTRPRPSLTAERLGCDRLVVDSVLCKLLFPYVRGLSWTRWWPRAVLQRKGGRTGDTD
eukprot:9035510-Pyramimonas_sp.AAC.1